MVTLTKFKKENNIGKIMYPIKTPQNQRSHSTPKQASNFKTQLII